MTYYRDQIIQLTKKLYPKDYLVKQVVLAKKFIDNHYTKPLTLDDMAGEAFFSKYHFIRLFKTMYGQTPYQYLKLVRIAGAKKLLQKGKNVSETSLAVGFESATSFASLFKKITGSTPSAFMKKRSR
jgi:AraC-like DNA-binding protein